jgi:hypothetical protein
LMVLLAYDLAEFDAQSISKLLFERVVDMLLGCAIALSAPRRRFRERVASKQVRKCESPAGRHCPRDVGRLEHDPEMPALGPDPTGGNRLSGR